MDGLISDLALLLLQPKPTRAEVSAMAERAKKEIDSELLWIAEQREALAAMSDEDLMSNRVALTEQATLELSRANRLKTLGEMLTALPCVDEMDDDQPTSSAAGNMHGGGKWLS